MWTLIFGAGALSLNLLAIPREWIAALPRTPPSWAPYALYFLVASLLRLAIRDARLRPLMKKAKAHAAETPAQVGVADLGIGVGKGVAQVVIGGDFLGPIFAGVDLLMKWLGGASARRKRIPAKILQAIASERRQATRCILVVGLLCAAQTLKPDTVASAWTQAQAFFGIGF